MAPDSPVALPDSCAGHKPTNAERPLPPKLRRLNAPSALLRDLSQRPLLGVHTWELFAIFSLPTTSVSLHHMAPHNRRRP